MSAGLNVMFQSTDRDAISNQASAKFNPFFPELWVDLNPHEFALAWLSWILISMRNEDPDPGAK
jgi:hypothetical protein